MKDLKDEVLEDAVILCRRVGKLGESRAITSSRGFDEFIYSTENDAIKKQMKNTLKSILILLACNYKDISEG